MNDKLYKMIFKRKSFHLFRNIGNEHLTEEELKDIEEKFSKLKPLVEDIKVKIKIVKKESILRGQEYCILFYSEKKDNYLQNIGYLGEQLDLYLVSKNIGTLWFGIGKPDEQKLDGLDFVIMIAIAKIDYFFTIFIFTLISLTKGLNLEKTFSMFLSSSSVRCSFPIFLNK